MTIRLCYPAKKYITDAEIQLKRREMAFPWISVGGNYGMRRNHGREIQLNRREMAFSWISVSGNGGMRRNHGREIQLNRRRMMFSWIYVGW